MSNGRANIEKAIAELENRLAALKAEQALLASELDALRGQLGQEMERTELRQTGSGLYIVPSSS